MKSLCKTLASLTLGAAGVLFTSPVQASDTSFRCHFKYVDESGYTKYCSFEISRNGRRDSPQDLCKEDLKNQTNLPVAADKLEYYMYEIIRI